MYLKFMPYMLATSVGGTPTTDTTVSTLMMSFCSTLIRPKRRIHQQLHLVQQMDLIVVQRSQIVAQRIEARLDRGREFRAPYRRDIGHDARQRQEAVADFRGQIAAGPETAQDRTQIRVFLGAGAAVPPPTERDRNSRCDSVSSSAAICSRTSAIRSTIASISPTKTSAALPAPRPDRCRTRSAVHSAP